MKKLIFSLLGLLVLIQFGGCQDDKTFTKPIHVVSIIYSDGSTQTTANSGMVDWAAITNKPNFVALYKPIGYVPAWAEITGKPTLFSGSYADLTNKPAEIDLTTAMGNLPYMMIPSRTTTEINALVVPSGSVALVWDRTLGVLKIWNGTQWKIYITAN
jgi:hypothetical protein